MTLFYRLQKVKITRDQIRQIDDNELAFWASSCRNEKKVARAELTQTTTL